MKNAEKTMKKKLSTGLYSGGGGGHIDGLLKICDDSTNYTTYGTINRSTNTWARAHLNTTGGSITLSSIQSMVGDCTYDNEKPDLCITTQTIYDAIWVLLQSQQRFPAGVGRDNDLARAGFPSIDWNGYMDIVVDSNCPSGYLFFINSDYLEFYVSDKRNFTFSGWKEWVNQDARSGQILTYCNVAASAPRYFGAMSGRTA